MSIDIVPIERRRRELHAAIGAETQRHNTTMTALRAELTDAENSIRLEADGIDQAKVMLAEHVLSVYGHYARSGEDRASVIEDAITDLLAGGVKLREQAFGTKDYAHWHGQRSDHSYGCGPRHGSLIFQVGFTRSHLENPRPLTGDEIEAAVYYLRNLERIQAAKAAAHSTAQAAR